MCTARPTSHPAQGLLFYLNGRMPTPHSAAAATAAESLQSCLTLFDPLDGSPPGSAIPGVLQARTLEWVAISFSTHSATPPQTLATRQGLVSVVPGQLLSESMVPVDTVLKVLALTYAQVLQTKSQDS